MGNADALGCRSDPMDGFWALGWPERPHGLCLGTRAAEATPRAAPMPWAARATA